MFSKKTRLPSCLAALAILVPFSGPPRLAADDVASAGEDILAGHSFHGEAFNEGPRQAAYLMPGMGNISFVATTENELVQRFVNQGVAQLHGFWYYEAERSFRQALVLDPQCAISYWGMAMANVENRTRAREFISQALELKETASRREQLFIEAFAKFCKDKDDKGKAIDKKTRAQNYTRDLEMIVEEFPDDIEAKAFLGLQLWQNGRADLPIVSHVAIDAVLQDVFDANPMHPAHHYRIHLWDSHRAKRALGSAALAGPSLPGIAHMWHMPGHIYSKLNRYQDAAWQQEASARVDHAHMMRDRVLPDQIHNFAHNNEWLIRNLLHIGRVEDALALAKNMQELPRHPKYNTLKKGSTKYGRERLVLALTTYRLWPELIALAETDYLQATADERLQVERLRHLAVAHALLNQTQPAQAVADELAARLDAANQAIEQLGDKQGKPDDDGDDAAAEKVAESESGQDEKKAKANAERLRKERDAKLKELKSSKEQLVKAVAAATAARAAAAGEYQVALDEWSNSDLNDNLLKAEWLAASGKLDESLKLLDKEIGSSPGEVLPVAVKAWVEFQQRGAEAARETFEQARKLAGVADLQTPLLARLAELASASGFEAHWVLDHPPPDDLGLRPDLDTLGSFRWHPYMAPDFGVRSQEDQQLDLKMLRGRPTLVIFYLGFGCLHCVEQLHEFSPRADEFRRSGIDVIAISSEDVASLQKGLSSYSKPLEIPLHADPELTAFRSYRCYDDFEKQPLHGTFLIDPDGKVLWQDISYEPFMDVDFVLLESHRLLKLHGYAELLTAPTTKKFTAR